MRELSALQAAVLVALGVVIVSAAAVAALARGRRRIVGGFLAATVAAAGACSVLGAGYAAGALLLVFAAAVAGSADGAIGGRRNSRARGASRRGRVRSAVVGACVALFAAAALSALGDAGALFAPRAYRGSSNGLVVEPALPTEASRVGDHLVARATFPLAAAGLLLVGAAVGAMLVGREDDGHDARGATGEE